MRTAIPFDVRIGHLQYSIESRSAGNADLQERKNEIVEVALLNSGQGALARAVASDATSAYVCLSRLFQERADTRNL